MSAEASRVQDQGQDPSREPGKEYLTFELGEEIYGVDILRVQEIRGWDNVTRIPNVPNHVKGVINIRGAIVPVFDLRLKFGLASAEYHPTTVVILLAVRSGGKERVVGFVVDGVSDVANVHDTGITAAPDFGAQLDTECMSGMATVDGAMVTLLDVDHMLNDDIENLQVDSEEESE